MKTVIATVGTSLFTNYMDDKVSDVIGEEKYCPLNDYVDKLKEKGSSEYKMCTSKINKISRIVSAYWLKGIYKNSEGNWEKSNGYNYDASAEIKSLIKIHEELNEDIMVYLLSTDTVLSLLSANILKDNIKYLCAGIKSVEIKVIEGLQINSYRAFKNNGLQNLYSTISAIGGKSSKTKEDDIILDISGGYKAIIPYLTIYGQLYDIPLKYIYEESGELISIPRLPVQFDWWFAERDYPYIENPDLYRNNKEAIKDLKNLSLIEYNKERGKYWRTAVGELFYAYIRNNMPVSKDVMGFFMEYKLYEYYIENMKDIYGRKYEYIKHSLKGGWLGDVELDIVLQKEKDVWDEFITMEVKSYYGFIDKEAFGKIKKQISRQIDAFRRNRKMPKEYYLYVYSPDPRPIGADAKNNIRFIRGLLEGTIFRAFKVKVDYRGHFDNGRYYKDINPIENFMSVPLDKDKIEEIIL